jgi:hypothetical protein
MPISSELFLAILAMDSYNRGYNAGLGGPVDGLGKTGKIGNATIGQTSEILLDASGQRQDITASFFAQSYTLTGSYASRSGGPSLIAGEKIISYRGTDDLPSALGGNGDWRDVVQWRQMVGSFDTPQQKLAA